MTRKMMVLNVLLLALLLWAGTQVHAYWQEAHAHQDAALSQVPKPAPVKELAGLPGVDPTTPAQYLDVAQRTLFADDRNPNEIITVKEPPPTPPPPPPPPVPPMPKYHGQMGFGKPGIVLSTDKEQRVYHVGDELGEFKIAAFDRDTLTLEWRDEKIQKTLKELTPKDEPKQQAAAPPPPPRQSALTNAAPVGAPPSKGEAILGEESGPKRLCVAGDHSPNGTVKDGYRKMVVNGMMGETCFWEPIGR